MIMGTSALSIRWTIARMDLSSPPGVSSWMTSAWARSACARSSASPTRRSVTGLITPSMSIFAMGAGAPRALHDVGTDECLPGERTHERERLVGGEPAHLGRAGGRRIRGVHRVDVEGAIDRPAPEAAEPVTHPGDALLLHRLDADHLDPVL